MQVPGVPRPGGDGLRQRDKQRPGLRARAGQGRRRDLRAVPGQPGHQRVLAPAGPAVPAAAVDRQADDDFPVQLLHNMITQPGERLPALRAAVPAALESRVTSNRGRCE